MCAPQPVSFTADRGGIHITYLVIAPVTESLLELIEYANFSSTADSFFCPSV